MIVENTGSKDNLGDRMKDYENVWRQKLYTNSYTIIRLDGKAFHSYTRGFNKPYDLALMGAMDETTRYLCQNIQGAKFAYVQSDEISIFITDVGGNDNSQIWYDGEMEKILTVSASMASAMFNSLMRNHSDKLAAFDSRVALCVDDERPQEVSNNFIWRQQDAMRNAISMLAQDEFSHKELHGVNTAGMKKMLKEVRGINLEDVDGGFMLGRFLEKEIWEKEPNVFRSRWIVETPPVFTDDQNFLWKRIPGFETI